MLSFPTNWLKHICIGLIDQNHLTGIQNHISVPKSKYMTNVHYQVFPRDINA